MSATRPETRSNGLTHRPGCNHPTPTRVPSQTSGFVIIRCPSCGATGLETTNTPPTAEHTTITNAIHRQYPDYETHGQGRFAVVVECVGRAWLHPTQEAAQAAHGGLRTGCGALECRLTHGHTIYEINGAV